MTESLAKNQEIAADPFAADIFAARRTENPVPAEESFAPVRAETPPWSGALPKVSARSALWDELLRRLPHGVFAGMPGALAQRLAGFLNLPRVKAIEFSQLMSREINRAEDFRVFDSWWLAVGVEASAAEIAFELDDAFAVWLVDAALGAETLDGGAQIRELTPSEAAVLEFLALNLTHEANSVLQTPLFRLRSVSRSMPPLLRQRLDSETPMLLTLSWRAVRESALGVVKMHVAPEDLQALQNAENQLAAADKSFAADLTLPKQIKNARARLRLGAAELSFAEFASLEAGDAILLENHGLTFDSANVFGRAEVFLGDAENAKISVELATDDFAPAVSFEETTAGADNKILVRRPNSQNVWRILVENLNVTENAAEKFMAETDDTLANETTRENADEGGGLAIENLAVTVRVEIEARRLSLAEINNLRENQVLELGARPTDPVNLLVDDQKIGRGELVLVEDRLGVRITKLLR